MTMVQNNRRNTPLHEAIESGHKEAVQSLIENRADVNAENQDRRTPLHFAAKKGNAEIIELLIRQNATINVHDKDGSTPLHEAVQCMDIAERVIDNIVNLFCTQNTNTPSHNDSHIDAVRVLSQAKGIDINATDKNECTPLHLAVVYDCVDTVKVLSQAKGIDVNSANEDRQTPLHLATLLGRTDIVKVLLQMKGIDVNATDKNGYTPLLLRLFTQYKIQHGTQYITDIAKAVGINVNITAPVLLLDENSNKKIVDALMAKDADPLKKDNNGRTAIDFDKNGYIKQFLRDKALKKSIFYGGATSALGTAVSVALFATGTITVELIPIVIAVATIVTTTLAVGGITYMMLKPGTEIDKMKAAQVNAERDLINLNT